MKKKIIYYKQFLCYRLVALKSGKLYLSSGGQQDAEEFLRALLQVLEIELNNHEGFQTVIKGIMGKQVEHKKFLDNPSGKCIRCGTFPSSIQETFLALKLVVPNCNIVELESLLKNYFGEKDNELRMKCSTCCKCSPVCLQKGFCNRTAVSQYSLLHSPKFLLIELLRFTNGHQGNKITTKVQMKSEINLQNSIAYDLLGVIDHQGNTIKSGHYVTSIKQQMINSFCVMPYLCNLY